MPTDGEFDSDKRIISGVAAPLPPRFVMGVMTKFWAPGQVKTRLADSIVTSAGLGNQSPKNQQLAEAMRIAADIHRRLIRHLLESVRQESVPRDLSPPELIVAPAETIPKFKAFLLATCKKNVPWRIVDQGTGTLGDRMRQWFHSHLSVDADRRCVLIGTDCPLLRMSDLITAWKSLENHDVVFGPATDGGYYLVGLTGRASADSLAGLFGSIAWSTDQVLIQSIRAAEQAGLSVELLRSLSDVDTLDDLVSLIRSLEHATRDAEFVLSDYESANFANLLSDLRQILDDNFTENYFEGLNVNTHRT